MNWDDLRVLHAFSESGTIALTARRLGVDASTVSRRLQELERELDVQLFARTPKGLSLTEAGHDAVVVARQVHQAVDALRTGVSGADARVPGVVRISCSEAFAPFIVQCVAGVAAEHPGLAIEISHANDAADVRQREADVAIRMYRDQREGLIQRKLGEVAWSLYASPAYVAARGKLHRPDELAGHAIVGYLDVMERSPGALWLSERSSPEAVVARAGSARSVCDTVLTGVGLSVLPCWLASGEPLVRLSEEVVAVTEVFAVFAPELRSVARVRIVVDQLVEAFRSRRDFLEGREP